MRSKCQNFLLLCDGKKYKIMQWEAAGIDRAEVEQLHRCMEPRVNKATSSTPSGMQQPQLLQEVLQKVSAVSQRGQWGKTCYSKRNEFYYLNEKNGIVEMEKWMNTAIQSECNCLGNLQGPGVNRGF